MSLPDQIDGPLEDWVTGQRWFASKSREVAAVNVLASVQLSASPQLDLELVALANDTQPQRPEIVLAAGGEIVQLGGGELALERHHLARELAGLVA